MDSLSTRARRFLGAVGAVASFSLIAAGLSPAAVAAPNDDTVSVADGKSNSRPDGISAQVTAKATGHRVEDLSQRTTMEQVFANPDGTWTSEASNVVRFTEKDGDLLPIEDLGTLESAGTAITGAGTELSIADGTDNVGDGPTKDSVPLATLAGTGEDKGNKLELGWEGDLPKPVVEDNTATYTEGVEVPVTDSPATGGDTADASVTVEPTNTGFSHKTVLDAAPEGDVELRFPIKLSKGLKAVQDKETGDLRAVDADGKTVFFAPAPTMWDNKIDKASGLHAAETAVETSIETEGTTPVLVLKASKDWLQAPEREYPVTIDPSWTSGVSDTWVQADVPGSKAGDQEIRVGTFNGGTLKSRSFLQFGSTALAGKKITKAELRLNNYYSYSCSSATVKVQRLTTAWTSSEARWTKQPSATSSGEGSLNTSKGYSSSCAAGYVYYPVTPIAQYWADNPTKNFGVRLIAADETNNLSWKRYRSANYSGTSTTHPLFVVTYNSYPYTPTAVSFGSGQSVKDASGKLWVKSLKPEFRATVSDPDGGNVKAEFDVTDSTGAVFWNKAAGTTVAAKSVSVLKGQSTSLVNGKTYTAKAWANDGTLRSKASGAATTFTVDTTAPTTPTVASTAYANNGWVQNLPSSNTLTFSTSSTDTAKFQYSKDGGSWADLAATGTNPRKATLSWNPSGAHKIQVKAIDLAGHVSVTATFSFMNGLPSMSSPRAGMTSSDAFKVTAKAPPSASGTVTPKVYWRLATAESDDGSTNGSNSSALGWNEAQTLDPIPANGSTAVSTTLDIGGSPKLSELGKARVPALVEIQVCYDYQSPAKTQCTTNTTNKATAVTRLPHAFGDAFPVAAAGPGQVALSTGELNLNETDVSLDAGGTGLSIARSYSSFSGLGANSQVFGPGWRAGLEGPDEGLAGMLVAESTALDGTVTLIDDDNTALVFRQPGNAKVSLKNGRYTPASDAAVESEMVLTVSGTGSAARIVVTESDGTTTEFSKGSELEPGTKIYEWPAASVTGPGSSGTTTYTRDANTGLTTRITAAAETGVDCSALGRGCRALEIAYDVTKKRVTSISFRAWDPASSAMKSVVVATYAYNATGQLVTVTDPRGTTPQSTTYTYGAASQADVPLLASILRTGEAKTVFGYGKGSENTRADWLESVKNSNPAGTGSDIQAARFVYGIDPTTFSANLPDVRKETIAAWEQDQVPTKGAAVFGASKAVASSDAKSSNITAADWKHANLIYWDDQSRTTNTASYGAGAWQFDTTVYDENLNVSRSYTPTAMAAIRGLVEEGETDEGIVSSHTDFATVTEYMTNEAGSFPTDSWAPVARNEAGDPTRAHTVTTYTANTEANALGLPYTLPTATTITEAPNGPMDTGATGEKELSKTTYGYDAKATFGGKAATARDNLTSGWVHGLPTTTTLDMNTGNVSDNITSRTWLDDQGRVVQSLQPASNGSDAGTTNTVYYSNATNSTVPSCGGNAEFAGLLCQSSQPGTGGITTLTQSYNMFMQPTRTIETGTGTSKRTISMTYRPDGQPDRTSISTSGLTGSTPVQETEKLYDSYGRPSGTRAVAGPAGVQSETSWAVDLWGRTTSYTNSLKETTTTTYSPAGTVAKISTPKSTRMFSYGAVDGDGAAEYRLLPTKMTISNHGAAGITGTYTASYDPAGNLISQTMPGGIEQKREYDEAGRPTTLTYSGQISTPEGTDTGTWVSWAQTHTTLGQIAAEASPDLPPLGEPTADGNAATYEKGFEYDRASRLIKVTDRTAAGASVNLDAEEGPVTPCTTRTYSFDKNGNRTNAATATNEECSDAGATTRTWSYDGADRLSGTGNAYDGLGRQTSIPAVDAPRTDATPAGTGAIALGYYDSDAARTIKRGSNTTTISLDPTGRRLILASNLDSTNTNHYIDESDNPGWVEQKSGSTTITTRYETSIGGDLAVTIENDTANLAISNFHGDTVATAVLPPTGNAEGIESWSQYDEYGNLQTTAPSTGANTYAWHGADQRALESSGLVLMGARLYNSVTGQFTSSDPIRGGNTTRFAYPQDPVGQHDTSGQYRACKTLCNIAVNVGNSVAFIGCRVFGLGGILCGAVVGAITEFSKYVYQWKGDRRFSWKSAGKAAALGAIVGGVSLGALKLIGRTVVYALKRAGKTAAARYFSTAFDVLYKKPKHRRK